MNTERKTLKEKANSFFERHITATLLLTTTLTAFGSIYAVEKIDERYWHPSFCAENAWLLEKPEEYQREYAERKNRVGEYRFFDINESLKKWSAELFLEELAECKYETNNQTNQ